MIKHMIWLYKCITTDRLSYNIHILQDPAGPAHWQHHCKGEHQSPINLPTTSGTNRQTRCSPSSSPAQAWPGSPSLPSPSPTITSCQPWPSWGTTATPPSCPPSLSRKTSRTPPNICCFPPGQRWPPSCQEEACRIATSYLKYTFTGGQIIIRVGEILHGLCLHQNHQNHIA